MTSSHRNARKGVGLSSRLKVRAPSLGNQGSFPRGPTSRRGWEHAQQLYVGYERNNWMGGSHCPKPNSMLSGLMHLGVCRQVSAVTRTSLTDVSVISTFISTPFPQPSLFLPSFASLDSHRDMVRSYTSPAHDIGAKLRIAVSSAFSYLARSLQTGRGCDALPGPGASGV